jgi:hypothetical protein
MCELSISRVLRFVVGIGRFAESAMSANTAMSANVRELADYG